MSVNTEKKNNELKTVSIEKNTWILELPEEICQREGFANGTLASLTVRNGEVIGAVIQPTQTSQKSAEKFIEKFGDFMREIEKID